MKFKEFLAERYVNALPNDIDVKRQYADEVWDILQTSYAKIGGIKGNGFKTKEDMINNIPFWKMNRRNGKIVAVVMYKDKNGRKSVAVGTDGSEEGAKAIRDMYKNDIERSYSEKSKAALGLLMKTVPWDYLKNFALTPKQAAKLTGSDVKAVSKMKFEDLPEDAQFTLKKFPQLMEFGYITEFGGKEIFKVAFGTIVGTSIK